MSLAVLYSRALTGMDAPQVTVEVHLANGLPAFTLVGLAEAEVKEARDRVRAALQNARFEFPARRITVNLAPADLPKECGRFDLPIALGHPRRFRPVAGATPEGLRIRRRTGADRRTAPDSRRAGDDLQGLQGRPRLHPAARQRRGSGAGRGSAGLSRPTRCSKSAPIWPAGTLAAPCSRASNAAHADLSRFQRGQRPAARQARAGSRRRRRPQHADERPAGHRQIHAGQPPARHPAADDRRPRRWKPRRAVAERRLSQLENWRRRIFRAPHHTASGVALVGGGGNPPRPAKSAWRTMACCFSTNCRNSTARRWKCCASRWNPGASPFPARRARPISRRASSWWRR